MKVYVGCFVAVCLIVLGIFFAVPRTQGQREQDEPTVVRKGQPTEKEKAYSKEYQGRYPQRKGQKLTRLVEIGKGRGGGKEVGVAIGVPTFPSFGNDKFESPNEFLSNLACEADAVVLGSVRGRSAHLTEDETFVYTEYEFVTDEILKNNSASPISVKESIDVTRPGGLINLDGQVIRVEDRSYEPLQRNKQYLLYLQYIPAVNGYIVSNVRGDFKLENDSFEKLSKRGIPTDLENIKESQTFLTYVRNSVMTPCNERKSGGD